MELFGIIIIILISTVFTFINFINRNVILVFDTNNCQFRSFIYNTIMEQISICCCCIEILSYIYLSIRTIFSWCKVIHK